MSTFVLASGPLAEIEAIFPQGSYQITAEIHEEAGAFTDYIIKDHIDILLPDQDEYEEFNLEEKLREAKVNGNQNRVSQILQADVICFTEVGNPFFSKHSCNHTAGILLASFLHELILYVLLN